jgi:hypothetical protein
MRKFLVAIFVFQILLLLPACSQVLSPEDDLINLETEEIDELTIKLIDQRQETAFEGYSFVLNEANQWNSEVSLYEIPSTLIVSNNIGLPAPGYYWFFMFSTDDSPREYYIAISDEEIAGTFEAEPLLFEELPYKLEPIYIEGLIDSDEALIICVENNLLVPQEIIDANLFVDYRLIDLGKNPIWSLYLSDADPYLPVCNIDAVTKEIVNDPYDDFFPLD